MAYAWLDHDTLQETGATINHSISSLQTEIATVQTDETNLYAVANDQSIQAAALTTQAAATLAAANAKAVELAALNVSLSTYLAVGGRP